MRHLIEVGIHWFLWPASGGAMLTLGQSEAVPTWLANSSTLTGTVVLAWFAWHTVTKTIPEMQRLFREEMAVERLNHTQVLAAKDAAHEREIAVWREMLSESMSSDRRAVHDTRDLAQTVISKVEAGGLGPGTR
jgi:hypothetical protein